MTEGALLAVFQGFAFLVGITLGSFANVAIDRLPHDRSLLPRSHCDTCGHVIRPRDLVPILSWALLRGRCRDCQAPIPAHVPLVELLVGLLSVLLMRRFIPGAAELDGLHLLAWGVYLGFFLLLVIATYVDVRHRIIPDQTSSWAAPFGIGAVALLDWLGYDGWLALNWEASVGGAVFGFGFFAVISLFYYVYLGVEGLGWGDVKLAGMLGAFLGAFPGVIVVMMVASMGGAAIGIVGTLFAKRRLWLPFGPSLAVASMLYVLYGDWMLDTFFPGMRHFIGGP